MERSCVRAKEIQGPLRLNDCQLTIPSTYVGIDAEPIKTYECLVLDFLDPSKTIFDLISEQYVLLPQSKSLYEMIDVDVSSKNLLQIRGRTETSSEDIELSDEEIISKLVNTDCAVHMPPRKKITVRAKVVSLKRAKPPV